MAREEKATGVGSPGERTVSYKARWAVVAAEQGSRQSVTFPSKPNQRILFGDGAKEWIAASSGDGEWSNGPAAAG